MLAPTRDLVAELNQRARAYRLAGRHPGPHGAPRRRQPASVGDVVITRTNDRRCRLGATDWVKNGDRWSVHRRHPDGGLRVQHLRSRPARDPARRLRRRAPSSSATPPPSTPPKA